MVQTLLNTMGQHSSLPKGRKKSLRSFYRKSFQNNRKTSLSHTFTITANESDSDRIEQLNINVATEEELMTLPGITREIAKNIVDHRKIIGRFRKVEDLVLVKGVGADRLQELQPEICVSARRSHSCASSRAPSYDSLKSADSRLTAKSLRFINVNKASVFELQSVNGINQQIAAAIVHYRNKKGPFKKLDDLMKIKYIDRSRFDTISRYLVLESNDDEDSLDEQKRPTILTNGHAITPYAANNSTLISNGHLIPPSIKLPQNGISSSSAMDIFELLSVYSPRPIIKEVFKYRRNDEEAIRIASWNLHQFSFEKSQNMGVREVICRTILENGFSIIAVQDVQNAAALKHICEELNQPKLRRVQEWKDKQHNWNFCMLDIADTNLGFIYDSDCDIEIELVSLHEGPEDIKNQCSTLIACFQIDLINVKFVNLMLHKKCNWENLQNKFKELIAEDDLVVVLIDLSNISNSDKYLKLGDLSSIVPPKTATNFQHEFNVHTANILCSRIIRDQHLTGHNGVVRNGLSHLAIPSGWSWGGPASPYFPVWTELFIKSNPGTAL